MPQDIESIKRQLREAKEAIRAKDQAIADLNKRIQDLEGELHALQTERPKLSPDNLLSSFGAALEKMQDGLRGREGPINYVVSNLDTDLKVNVTLDERGSIAFELPRSGEVASSESLSTLRFSIKPTPKAPAALPGTMEVPNLIAMHVDAALDCIRKAKLAKGEIAERVSLAAPGTVVEQHPAPYSRIPIASSVALIICKVKEVRVPNLIGMNEDDAIDMIGKSKLTVGKMTLEFSDSRPNTVISQSITAGTLVRVETSIDLLIAKLEMAAVPRVVGRKLKDARRAIQKARLNVGAIAKAPSEETEGTVIEQSPGPDKEVPVGTQVDMVTATPEVVTVPNVTGMPKESAADIFAGAKLRVGRITERRDREQPGIVIEQRPRSGAKVPINTAVDIVVSKPQVVRVPSLLGLNREKAEGVARENDLRIGNIAWRKSGKPEGMIIAQKPRQGAEVAAGTPISLTISKGGGFPP